MNKKFIKITALIITLSVFMCTTICAIDTNLIPVPSYSNEYDYSTAMSEAIADGSEYAIAFAKICEQCRNLKIQNQNLPYLATNIFTSDDICVIRQNLNAFFEEQNTKLSNSNAFLLSASNVDQSYSGQSVALTDTERQTLAEVLYNEFGNDYTGVCLVAQSIRDAMTMNGYTLAQVRKVYQYKYTKSNPPQECYDAISYIFDQGNSAVQHQILFMYATKLCYSSWHESQEFVVEYNSVRFFDLW